MGEVTSVRPQNGNTPDWYAQIATRFRNGTAHAFGLTGAINDYVLNSYIMKLETYLLLQLQQRRKLILVYSTHEGVRFADEILPEIGEARRVGRLPSMRNTFATLMGLDKKQNVDPTIAAMRLAGGQGAGTAEDLGRDPGEILPLLSKLIALKDQEIAVIIEHVENVCPAGDIAMKPAGERNALAILEAMGHETRFILSGNLLILIAPSASDVHPVLRTASCRYQWFNIALPNEAERLDYAKWALVEKTDLRFEKGMTVEEFAGLTSGLAKFALEDILLASEVMPDKTVRRAFVRERKKEIIRQEFQDVIALLDTDVDFSNIGGHDIAKTWLMENVVEPIRSGARAEVPTGILLIGPPGTGKTMLVSALGRATGFNVIKLNPEKIFSKFVGEAERNLSKLLEACVALAPVYLFIDEVDQKVSRGDGGSQVFNNIFGMLLEFLSQPSNRGNIVAIAATNKPELIDPALVRAGRFEVKIPIMPADDKDRADTFRVILAGYGADFTTFARKDEIISLTEDWTQAEVGKLVAKAKRYTRADGAELGEDHVFKALKMTRRRAQDYTSYIQSALDCTEDIELLPERWQKIALGETEPAKIEPTSWRSTRQPG
jgi:SpoVK/Ycf46/Vps4 family AAA+-type ATPase